jgi:SAM-dependent methyltransferase
MFSTSEPQPITATREASQRVACRQCGADATENLGAIPSATVFAGQPLQPAWEGGSLLRCARCHLVFRHPIRSDDEYEALYAKASEQVWVSGALRADQRLVLDRIESHPAGSSVLDVGCYDGSLLAALTPRFRRYGVEPSTAAADKARERGIEIVAKSIAGLAGITETFGVICAVDVIEHVSRPRDFLATLAQRLSPRGRLVISTGNADAEAWRDTDGLGGLYWYCGFPEHISFVSPAWAENVAAGLGLRLTAAERFAYGELDAGTVAKQRRRYRRKLAQAALRCSMRAWLPRPLAPAPDARSLGQPGVFEDHVLLVFERAA